MAPHDAKTRHPPRWLSGWGLIAALPYLAAGFLVLFGITEPMSTIDSLLQAPLGIQEMVLALWLIVKGFNPTAVYSLNTVTDTHDALPAPVKI